MQLSKIVFAIVITCIFSCKERDVELKIVKVRVTDNDRELFDTVYGREIRRSDSKMFWYDGDDFKEGIDTLLIYDDRVQLHGETLELVREKYFIVDGRAINIEKYYSYGDGFHSFNIHYINRELGIVVFTNYRDMIFEYNYLENRILIDKIINDSLFFGYE